MHIQRLANAWSTHLNKELLDSLAGATVFSTIALSSAFHQIQLDPDDAPKTTFMTHNGLFEYVVLPFGLSDSPAILQNALNCVLSEYINKFVHVYLHDIVVFSRSYLEHVDHITHVFNALRKHEYYCRLDECHFRQRGCLLRTYCRS
jgi:hypothetical protein